MTEPWVPEPIPLRPDPTQARCPECRRIIDAHPASRKDGRWEGWCEEHGTVIADYASQDSEMPYEKEES